MSVRQGRRQHNKSGCIDAGLTTAEHPRERQAKSRPETDFEGPALPEPRDFFLRTGGRDYASSPSTDADSAIAHHHRCHAARSPARQIGVELAFFGVDDVPGNQERRV